MALRLGDIAPDFSADTSEGKINFHEWIGQQLGNSIFPSEGFHSGLHDRAWLHGRPQARVRKA